MRLPLVFQAPVLSLSGYGSHARDIFNVLMDSDDWEVHLIPVQWGGTSTTGNFSRDFLDKVVFASKTEVNPDRNKSLWMQLGTPNEFRPLAKVNIGVTAGVESDTMTQEFLNGCNSMTAVIATSEFVRRMFMSHGTTIPIHTIFEPYDKVLLEKAEPTILNIPTKFNFLCVGQWGAGGYGQDRKNIGLLISEFCKIYKDNPDIGLILKTSSRNVSSADKYVTQERILAAKLGLKEPSVYLIHGDLTDEEMYGLYKSPQVNVLFSPTHGEGFWRPGLEAAVSGVPIVVTGWGGHTDFLSNQTSTFIDYELLPVPSIVYQPQIWAPGMRWAEPNIDQIRRFLREVPKNYETLKARAMNAREGFQKTFTQEEFKTQLLTVLDKYRSSILGTKIVTIGSLPLASHR